jgi:hypothetical protein
MVNYFFSLILLIYFLIFPSLCAPSVKKQSINIKEIKSILTLHSSEEKKRYEYARKIMHANTIVRDFAVKNGWRREAYIKYFDSVEIFASQEKLWERILTLHGMPLTTPMPSTGLAAALEKRILMAITPEKFKSVRPEYTKEKFFWEKLLAHEIVHRLHVEILDGDEDAMGPIWFFEGFAIYGSDQEIGQINIKYNSAEDALNAVQNRKVRGAYVKYAATFLFFLKKTSLHKMIKNAGNKDFREWLLKL